MGFNLKGKESIQKALRRIAKEQIDAAIAEVDNPEIDRHEVVHQVRKRCKKIRGLIRLVRPCFPDYRDENDFFRDAAAELSFVRDAQSVIETFDALIKESADVSPENFAAIRERLVEARTKVADQLADVDERLAEFRQQMLNAKDRVLSWQIEAKEFAAIEAGLIKTYNRGVHSMQGALKEPTPENYHEWRKRSKYHWYHLRLIQKAWPNVVDAFRKEVSELCDLLGEERDLTLLADKIKESPESFGDEQKVDEFLQRIRLRRKHLRKAAKQLGALVFAEKPKHLQRRIDQYWRVWRKSGN